LACRAKLGDITDRSQQKGNELTTTEDQPETSFTDIATELMALMNESAEGDAKRWAIVRKKLEELISMINGHAYEIAELKDRVRVLETRVQKLREWKPDPRQDQMEARLHSVMENLLNWNSRTEDRLRALETRAETDE
jgi:polyhydroxyalkanoate synthesis regulator phasin